ncbi:hypothetical protein F4777DRAFT_599026 [Nemania sp. FL0916]|nr:hypothetical protein F4777DRAFT_599026 [Nemania sp. FL0916]
MSSTTGLNRTRSIRQPAARDNEPAQSKSKQVHDRSEPRNVSPSRLPVKPLTTTSTRTRAPTGPTSRQTSGGPSARTSSRSAENGATSTSKPLGRAHTTRQAPTTGTATSTSSTAVSRSSSTSTRPRSSTGHASTSMPRERHAGHSRAKSTATALAAATTLRPLTHAPPRSNPSPAPSTASSTSTATQSVSTTTSTRVQTRSQTQQHTRAPSQSQTQSQPKPKPSSQSHYPPQSRSAAAAASAATRRPAFNTNQKHYTPAKSLAPKPLTSTFLAPPSPSKQPVNVALSAETSRLQTELLQLSLLYREANETSTSWHRSAREKLGRRFEAVRMEDRELRDVERRVVEDRGLRDLGRWGEAEADSGSEEDLGSGVGVGVEAEEALERGDRDDARPRSNSKAKINHAGSRDNYRNEGKRKEKEKEAKQKPPLDEKIRLLDQVLSGAWALSSEPRGRYRRATQAFEVWAHDVAAICAAQRAGDVQTLLSGNNSDESGSGDGSGEAMFVDDVDASGWKRDHAGLVRMLDGWRQTLKLLGTVPVPVDDADIRTDNLQQEEKKQQQQKSGLARTLTACRGLVDGMLAELRAMERFEQDARAAEELWMLSVEKRFADDEGRDKGRGGGGVLPWKMLGV